MNKTDWIKIIDYQVKLILKEHGLKKIDLSIRELCKYRLELALKLLEELG